jgi:hypothetical protein
MWRKRVLAAVAMSVAAGVSAGQAAPMGNTIKLGNWSGGAYADDTTGRFSHCAVSSPYRHGVSLFFMVSRDYQWAVAFASPQFNFATSPSPGGADPLVLHISLDEGERNEVRGYVLRRDLIKVNLAPTGDLFKKFMRAALMRLHTHKDTYGFALQDTSRVLPELLRCVRDKLGPMPIQPPGAAQQRASTVPVSSGASPQPDLRAEVTALAANLLSEAGVKGFRLLPPSGDPSDKTHVGFAAPAMTGSLLVLLDPAVKRPTDATPRLVALAAERCKGKFMSGAMPEENGAARVFSSCQVGAAEPTMGFYLTLPRGAGGHYVLIMFPRGMSGTPAPPSTQEPDKDFRTAAYRVLK